MNFAAMPLPPSGEEKTVPFLRNLADMLEKNSGLISFIPGEKCTTQTTPGKIVIHDRNLVQEEVLPIYFNHKSFASLRRQLSYFSFVRVGKSSNGKVTYANDSVFELSDILKLKRRSASSDKKAQDKQHKQQHKKINQQETNQNMMASSTAKEVASAVTSGMLNAAKANDKLDSMKKCQAPSLAPNPAVTSSNFGTSSTTHSSLSASSDNEGNSKKISSSNKKKRSSSLPKYKLRRKDRARLKQMLYYNRIVPFIHFSSTPMMADIDTNSNCIGGANQRDSEISPCDAEVKCNNKKKRSNTNETAIDALLSLGAP